MDKSAAIKRFFVGVTRFLLDWLILFNRELFGNVK